MKKQGFFFLVVACVAFAGTISEPRAQQRQTTPECPDGRYEGRLSGKKHYLKDEYVWAVTPEFAKRFCMPPSFIAEDLKGAEAIAYQHRPSGVQVCEVKDGQEVCAPQMKSHWLEIYVKSDANIPKFDPEVKYFVDKRDLVNSSKLINHTGTPGGEQRYVRNHHARERGEIVEAPGDRAPFFGRGPAGDGKRILFTYLSRVEPNKAEILGAGLSEHFYQANWFDGIDLIALEGWSMGNVSSGRVPPAKFGYALVPRVEYSKTNDKRFPDDFEHVIYMPKRIVEVMHEVDRKGGQAFQDAIRNMLEGKPHSPWLQ